ncbi:hypothetical protein J4H92_06875 [Leucobacter weissii]|uniref:Uncharacterized protein n=1 Tax=Leucobacter weissii TaxID=1983706 RepID=A0A939SBQ5_9MICO|nr:hypothetical protein [Leucobacter weissii]MBO1901675.1 hypothetical protein [Leucobacter weissii]
MSHPLVPDNRLLARRPGRPTLLLALLAVLALVAGLFAAVNTAATPAHAAGKTAKVTIAKVTAKAAKVTVRGKVTLPSKVKGKKFTNTAKNRKQVRVALTLQDSAGKKQTFTAKITKNRSYSASKTTKLTGKLTVVAQTKIRGKNSGKKVTKKNAVTVAAASVTIGSVTLANERDVTVAGRVTLPAALKNTAANRKKVTVAVTLTDYTNAKESFTATIDASRKYTVKKTTALSGPVTVTAQARVSGKASGSAAKRTNAVSVETDIPAGARKLEGLFRFDPGQDDASGKTWGTYFRMIGGTGLPFTNDDSPARDKTYTLLRPGTDGGLSTTEYQEPPEPAFDGELRPDGFRPGNALANRITQPQKFFGVGFSISTAPFDAQSKSDFGTDVPSPLPEIYEKDGKLYGQVTGWTASWNGSWFNQGSPKPEGTPAGWPATPLTGTYDPATKHYTLHWTSRIYGGAFQGAWGHWYLEGTFEPAAEED